MSVIRKPWLAESQREPRLRLLGDRLARLTPVVPPLKTRVGGRVVAATVMRRQLRKAVATLGNAVHAVIVIPPHFPVFGVTGEALSVHLASDDFVAGARLNGVSPRWVQRQEQRIAQHADRVVTVSLVLQEKWQALGHNPVLITNGCDYELFAAADTVSPATDVSLSKPIAAFIGTLSERTDIAFLDAVAARGHSLLLVGPRSHTAPHAQLDAVLARPNVQWVGRRRHTEVPSYLRHVDVGLVPYTDNDFNRASFPLKVLDYLSAGLPVVASDLPSIRWLDTDLIDLASNAEAFADAVEEALRYPGDEQLVARRRRFASRHSWDTRVAQLADVLDLKPGERRQSVDLVQP
jgi:teichuronic acid biosynthesis glycosyltransferase TuaH